MKLRFFTLKKKGKKMPKIFIESLPRNCTAKDLKDHFAKYIPHFKLRRSKNKGRKTKMHAILEISSEEDFKVIISKEHTFQGEKLKLKPFTDKKSKKEAKNKKENEEQVEYIKANKDEEELNHFQLETQSEIKEPKVEGLGIFCLGNHRDDFHGKKEQNGRENVEKDIPKSSGKNLHFNFQNFSLLPKKEFSLFSPPPNKNLALEFLESKRIKEPKERKLTNPDFEEKTTTIMIKILKKSKDIQVRNRHCYQNIQFNHSKRYLLI